MARVSGADNNGRDLRTIQYGPARHGSDVDTMSVGNCSQHAQQMLQDIPAATVIDDELVFGQRAILQIETRLGTAEPIIAQESTGNRTIAQEMHAIIATQGDQPMFGPVVKQGILNLHAYERHAGVQQRGALVGVEIRSADEAYLAQLLKLGQPDGALDASRYVVIPPVILHEVETLHPQPVQRTVDRRDHVRLFHARQEVEIGNEFRMHLQAVEHLGAIALEHGCPELAEQFLDAGINVGAIEGDYAGAEKRAEICYRCFALDGSVTSRELPAAADDTGDFIARPQFRTLNTCHSPGSLCRGTAVVCA